MGRYDDRIGVTGQREILKPSSKARRSNGRGILTNIFTLENIVDFALTGLAVVITIILLWSIILLFHAIAGWRDTLFLLLVCEDQRAADEEKIINSLLKGRCDMRINNDLTRQQYVMLVNQQSTLSMRIEEELRRVNVMLSRAEEMEKNNEFLLSTLQDRLSMQVTSVNH
jgi:hypothetical protein